MREPVGFRDYVEANQAALRRRAVLLTGDPDTAEDLVQTALMRVWPHWNRIDAAHGAYIATTMTRTFLSWRGRRWHGEAPTAELPERESTADPYAAADLRDQLARLLPGLPARQRATVVLRFYDDLTEAQTAEALGCSVGTVKSQTSRAITRLRAALAADAEPGAAATDLRDTP
ncbi:MAG: SigE family RNA polymerase sigma factor [Mycobacteriales bacterium]